MKPTRMIPYFLILAITLAMGCSRTSPTQQIPEIPPAAVASPVASQSATPVQASPTSSTAEQPTLPSDADPTAPQSTALPTIATTEPVILSADASEDAPAMRDVLDQFSDPPQAIGQVLILYGRVLDTSGAPLPGAVVEIWQTDAQGRYDHPNAPGTAQRDPAFQFYGSTIADAQGVYSFRTLIPGEYEPRPAHIHFKVRLNGVAVLTSQFYFAQDRDMLSREGLFRAAGDQGELLILEPQPIEGQPGLLAALKDIVLLPPGATTALTLFPTPAQAEGPFYPRVDVSAFDNDLMAAR